MTSTKLFAFIIGAGSNVGQSVAQKLKAEGYSVALGSRKPDVQQLKAQGFLPVSVDVTDLDSISNAFETVRKELGAPSVVVYNAAISPFPPERADPLSLSRSDFSKSINVAEGMHVAAQEMLRGLRETNTFETTPRKAFIVTGNALPFIPPAPGLSHFYALSAQKALEAELARTLHGAYKEKGIRFHYALLVSMEGGIPNLNPAEEGFFSSGPTHAKVYWDLISKNEPEGWDYRFTLDGKYMGSS